METYPPDTIPNLYSLNPTDWANESYEISSTVVYKNIKEKEALPQEYVDSMLLVAEKRIAMGGYRLANLLVNMTIPSF